SGNQKDPLDCPFASAHGAKNSNIVALILYQHDEPRNYIQGRDENDESENQEHHVALHRKSSEERLVAPNPGVKFISRARCQVQRLEIQIDIVGFDDAQLDAS